MTERQIRFEKRSTYIDHHANGSLDPSDLVVTTLDAALLADETIQLLRDKSHTPVYPNAIMVFDGRIDESLFGECDVGDQRYIQDVIDRGLLRLGSTKRSSIQPRT